MKHQTLISVLAGAVLCATGGCTLHPRPADAGNEILPPAQAPGLPYHISGMHIRLLPATTFVYSTMHTSFEDMAAPTAQAIDSLRKLHQSGPILFVYHDPTEDPVEPFDLDVGIAVPNPIPASSDFQVRNLPPFHCATAIYRGPMKLLPKAYDKLIPQMIAAGFIPSEETRESYEVWESADSPNNVVQIEVGIR